MTTSAAANTPRVARTNALLIAAVSIVFLIVNSDLVTRGMMPDGTLYAAIARDLANGSGSFWSLPSYLPHEAFHDHLPLGIYMESLLFRATGDHFWVENLYAIIMLFIAIYLMHRLSVMQGVQASWYGVLMVLVCPLAAFTYTNNFLENTLVVFGLLALYAALESVSSAGLQAIGFAAVSGVAIFAGLLVKGPVGLWPLSVLPLYWIVYRPPVFKLAPPLLAQAGALAACIMLVMLSTQARSAVEAYVHAQLLSTATGVRQVEWGRSFMLWTLTRNLAVPILYSVILLALARARPTFDRNVVMMAALGLCASIPLLASPRQYQHYVLPSLPLFALAIAFATRSFSTRATARLATLEPWVAGTLACLVLAFGFIAFDRAGSVNQDREQLEFVTAATPYLDHTDVEPCKGFDGLRLQMYLYRYLDARFSKAGAPYVVCDVPQREPVVVTSSRYSLSRSKGYSRSD